MPLSESKGINKNIAIQNAHARKIPPMNDFVSSSPFRLSSTLSRSVLQTSPLYRLESSSSHVGTSLTTIILALLFLALPAFHLPQLPPLGLCSSFSVATLIDACSSSCDGTLRKSTMLCRLLGIFGVAEFHDEELDVLEEPVVFRDGGFV